MSRIRKVLEKYYSKDFINTGIRLMGSFEEAFKYQIELIKLTASEIFRDIEELNNPVEDIFITSEEFNKLKKKWEID